MAREPMVPLNLRVPSGLLQQLDERATVLNRDRSECIREAIEAWLVPQPRSLEARVEKLEGRMAELEAGSARVA
ncbi:MULTISPECIES: ribbon-helix-helix protein, CopG family [unclassified Brevundimonas]|uniref:ribbon-helix-helix protein, CopG family n=1 Tax=unclassified Brevundimonas TaxID=2622653 RepID=UPI003916F246